LVFTQGWQKLSQDRADHPDRDGCIPESICHHPKWDMKVEGRTYEALEWYGGQNGVMIGEALASGRYDVDEEEITIDH
jgi:hypothetical protein